MDDAVRGALEPALSEIGATRQVGDDEAVWFIRHLRVEVTVNAASGREHIARSLATGIGTALVRAMKAGSDGDNIVRFESRAAHLARFLRDLARVP